MLSTQTLADAAGAFGLGPATAIRRSPGTHLHVIYRCNDAGRVVALKRLTTRPDLPGWLERFQRAHRVQSYLADTAAFAPRPLLTREGLPIARLGGAETPVYFVAYEWVTGKAPVASRDLSHFAELCRIVAIISDAPMDLLGTEQLHAADDPVPDLDTLVRQAHAASVHVPPSLLSPQASVAIAGCRSESARARSVICHRDLSPRNLIVHKRTTLIVLDWENVGLAPPEQEYGRVFVEWVLSTPIGERSRVTSRLLALLREAGRDVRATWFDAWLQGHLMYTSYCITRANDPQSRMRALRELRRLSDFLAWIPDDD
jgi:aminoglycoside phosphotransferase (APT) family kinase protein